MKLTTLGAPSSSFRNSRVASRRSKALEYNWGGSDIRWELEAFGGATRLTLKRKIDRRFISWGAAASHICFDVL